MEGDIDVTRHQIIAQKGKKSKKKIKQIKNAQRKDLGNNETKSVFIDK